MKFSTITNRPLGWFASTTTTTVDDLKYERSPLRNEDVWSFDHYLAGIIAEGCRKLTEPDNSHGYPPSCEQPDDPLGDKAVEAWHAILVRMAEGFEAHAKDELDNDEEQARIKEALDLFREWFFELWD